jgi:hypothetical protein
MESIEPQKVKVATDMYREENDIYKQFENQCVFIKKDSKLTSVTLYSHFKEWFREECPNHPIPTRNAVRHHFISQWGDLDKGKHWLHKTCRQVAIDDDDKANPFL